VKKKISKISPNKISRSKVADSRNKAAEKKGKQDPFAQKIEHAVKGFKEPKNDEKKLPSEGVRLNKFIANAGVCARRKADEFIKQGFISVNDQVVLEMGYRVQDKDVVKFKGKKVVPIKFSYILLNKPKSVITTTDDDMNRKTVMDIVQGASQERIYPVGRLDRNTTGVLLLTNDGELAQKLSHPSSRVTKVYQVELNKPLEEKDRQAIKQGLTLEDGLAQIDEIEYTLPRGDDKHVGIELHIGKNRIVRRIFEHLGYEIIRLDRVLYAGLTKKNVPRGKWRYLTDKEIIFLKHFAAYEKKK
jgi:23S rRNA pseudouridine2605 synthase